MTPGHAAQREALGAYVLGALEPDEHAALDRHLAGCATCREEVDAFRALPPLLDRLSPDEAAAAGDLRPRHDVASTLAAVAAEQQRARRALWRWRAAAGVAAVAAAVLLAVVVPWPRPAAVYEAQPAVAAAQETQGRVTVTERPWGMRVALDVRDLPVRQGYSLWAVDGDEHRAMAASWSATDGGEVRLDGACYMAADEVVRFELVAEDELLATFEAVG